VRLITDNLISLLQQNRLRWYGHVSVKDENDWVKNAWIMKCRVHELDVDQRNLGQKLWEKTVRSNNYTRWNAMDCSDWKKLIKEIV